MVMRVDAGLHFLLASHRQNNTSTMRAAIKTTIMPRASTTIGSLCEGVLVVFSKVNVKMRVVFPGARAGTILRYFISHEGDYGG